MILKAANFPNKPLMFLARLYVKPFLGRQEDLDNILKTWYQTHAENTGLVLSSQNHEIVDVYLKNSGEQTKVIIHTTPAFAAGINDANAIPMVATSLRGLIQRGLVRYHGLLNPRFTPLAGTPAPNSNLVTLTALLEIFTNFLELSSDLPNFRERIFSRHDLRNIYGLHIDPTPPTATISYYIPSVKITADLLIKAYLMNSMNFVRWLSVKRFKKDKVTYEHHALEIAGGFFIQNTIDSDIITTTGREFIWTSTEKDVTLIPANLNLQNFYERIETVLANPKLYSPSAFNCESFCHQVMKGECRSLQVEQAVKRLNPVNIIRRLRIIKKFQKFIEQNRMKP
ncbi:hypothetical protein AZI86_10640 [Bdellovibrio bacteriovorus]|uniref:Uncharacterized protein n=2 Tax=Bdellovibrio bacteriovorus TaxID=959 RepID=A0A150WLT6_BDEBC|nr:hypothetical protein AZI86_10640 [Bdellovibrio bacteriovorus]